MSNVFRVSSLSELYNALASVKGGETILLAAGNYGDMALGQKSGFDTTFASNVTIASADPANPAIITGLDVRDTANLTFDGITFDYTFEAGDEIYARPFSVSGSENITIRNSTFDGDVASGVSDVSDGYGYAIGLSFRDTAAINIENNEFFNFYRGMVVTQSADVLIKGNDIHDIRMDGMNFAEIDGITIEDNYIHDFRGSVNSLDHSDMIQFWTNGTDSPSSNIIIRSNHLDIGEGTPTQSIFMRNDLVDRGLAGSEMFYQNVVIEDNVITNGHLHGITIGETAGLAIRNNSVLHADGGNVDGADASVEIPQINVSSASTNVIISNNATAGIRGLDGQLDWTLTNNAFVQDQNPFGPGFYGDVFISSSMAVEGGIHDFKALAGGMLDRLDAGAATTLSSGPSGPGITTAFHIESVAGDQALVHFDASYSQVDAENLPIGTRVLWTFGDGSTAEGLTVEHAFTDGGIYNVTLELLLPDGRTDSKSLAVPVQSSEVLSFASSHGFVVNEYGTAHALENMPAIAAEGLVLGANGVAAQIDHTYVARILGQENLEISMSLAATTQGSQGEIVRLHGSFVTSVTAQGELFLDLSNTAGERIRLTTQGADLSDLETHDISINLADGILSITVDGAVLAQTEMSGGLVSLGDRDLTFGNPWGRQNFDGVISAFNLNVNADDFAVARAAAALEPEPANAIQAESESHSQQEPVEQAAQDDIDAATSLPAAQPESDQVPTPITSTTRLIDYSVGNGLVAHDENGVDIRVDMNEDAKGLDLGGSGVAASVDRAYVADIFGADAFQISMSLQADHLGSAGEVMRLHSSFVTSIDEKGELFVQAFSTVEGRIRLKTDGAHLNNTEPHDISLTLKNGVLTVAVDGEDMASAAMTGTLVSLGSHDIYFGNPWGKDNFDGHLSSFTIATQPEVPALNDDIMILSAIDDLQLNTAPLDVDVNLAFQELQDDIDAATSLPAAQPESDQVPTPITSTTRLIDYSVGNGLVAHDENGVDIRVDMNEDAKGLDLGGSGVAASVDRAYVADIFGADAFQISMSLQADHLGSAGEVMRLHSSFVTSIDEKGELFVQAFSTVEGRIRLKTDGAHLNNTEPHDISLTLKNGVLTVAVDGEDMASAAMTGTLVSLGSHDIYFGNPWGKDNFDGHLSSFTIATQPEVPALNDDIMILSAIDDLQLNTAPLDVDVNLAFQELQDDLNRPTSFYEAYL
jgi:PKD repeat protein